MHICRCITISYSIPLLLHNIDTIHTQTATFPSVLYSSKTDDSEVKQQQALSIGTVCEFEEKSRIHIGTITLAEHKANGGARYTIEDTEGHKYDIADKQITFATPRPTNDKQVEKLLAELSQLQEAAEDVLCSKLEVSPDLLEMAWEEAADEEHPSHELTAKSFIKLIHSKGASAVEEYMAWRLLKGEMAHVFFKELKQNGRVLSFKAKARKAVDNAKEAFCSSHNDVDFCFV